ncbi:MAG: serine/threonine protein kinase, partial [Myxococcaceae bacterium]|nr:serine/threonine protein kinase [Myxococcaceae bacterium]
PLNIVHRDISPDNIIVGINGETKLVDFGVAKSMLEGRAETEAGVIKGKYIYFSPEQAAGEKVDFRTDIYALGVVLYRLVTGVKAFDGPGLKVLQQVQKGEYVPLRVANPGVPDDLATVIETMMATRKENRFQTTLELVEALSTCVVHMAPRAGVHWIRDWVRWLYQEDLKKRGESPDLRAGFTDLIEQWRPGPKPTVTGEVMSGEARSGGAEYATIDSRREGSSRRRATGGSMPRVEQPPVPPWSPKMKLYAALAGAGALALLAGVVVLTSTKDPGENESDDARNRRVAEAMRMKPISGDAPAVPAVPRPGDEPPQIPGAAGAGEEPGADDETAPVAAKVEERVPEVAYDAEVAPVTFMLTSHHQVSLDTAPTLPGTSGTVTGAGPLTVGGSGGRANAWSFPDLGDPSGRGGGTKQWVVVAPGTGSQVGVSGESQKQEVPAWLFSPGKTPVLDLLANGTGRWSRPDTKLAVLVGSASEVPPDPLSPTLGSKKIMARGAAVVVEATDRFSISDLSTRQSWKVTVSPKPQAGESVGQVVMHVRGGPSVRVDGRPTLGGYVLLSPGTHRVSGAQSGWFTVPTVTSLKLAAVEVSFAD